MNVDAFDILVGRLKVDGLTTAEELRLLAQLHEQTTVEIVDLLNIVADRVELDEREERDCDPATDGCDA